MCVDDRQPVDVVPVHQRGGLGERGVRADDDRVRWPCGRRRSGQRGARWSCGGSLQGGLGGSGAGRRRPAPAPMAAVTSMRPSHASAMTARLASTTAPPRLPKNRPSCSRTASSRPLAVEPGARRERRDAEEDADEGDALHPDLEVRRAARGGGRASAVSSAVTRMRRARISARAAPGSRPRSPRDPRAATG